MLRTLDYRVAAVFERIINKQCAVKPGEHVLIAADTETEPEMLTALSSAVGAAGGFTTVAVQPAAGWIPDDLYALTDPLKAAYCNADLTIVVGRSSSATLYGRPQEWRDMQKRRERVRMFSLVERTLKVMQADYGVDYFQIREFNKKLKEYCRGKKRIRLTTPAGTDFSGSLEGFDWDGLWAKLSEDGFSLKAGDAGNCPDGEVHFPCPPESMEGTIVADGPLVVISPNHPPDKPIHLKVKKGRIVDIRGGQDAARMKKYVESIEQDWVSEIGIGTNPHWIMSDCVHAVKKGIGNLHVAFGGWWGFQPNIPYKVHADMVLFDGTIEVDGKVIMANATFDF